MNKTYSRISTVIFWCFVCYCGVLTGLYVYGLPLIGDDLFYSSDLDVRGGGIKALPTLMSAVYIGTNGRWGDITNTIWLTLLPRVVTAVCAFVFTILLPWASVRLCGLNIRQTVPVLLLTMVIVFLLPWWDMTYMVCLINYPWGAAVVLTSLIPLLGNCQMHSKWWIAALPVAAMGAAWHEAAGLPLAVGLGIWCCLNHEWHRFSVIKRWWFAAMICGGLFTISSPAIWRRAGSPGSPDGSIAYLLLTSANLSVILFIVIVWIIIMNKSLIRRLLQDSFVVFAIASLISACAVIVGGIEGRSGLFAQIFGAIALMRIVMLTVRPTHSNKVISTIIAVVLYVGCGYYATQKYRKTLFRSDRINEAISVYPLNHELGYSIIKSTPGTNDWDMASLKVLDPQYDFKHDRNKSLKFHAAGE